MKRLTKSQYEAIAQIFSFQINMAKRQPHLVDQNFVQYGRSYATLLATLFESTDTEFNRQLFLEQCGIKD